VPAHARSEEFAGAALVQLLVGETLPFAKCCSARSSIATASQPGILSAPGRPARMIALAVSCVRRRLLITQTARRGSCSARPMKVAASEQSGKI
jgi:hypothetical protein